jgi:hypothetical protein
LGSGDECLESDAVVTGLVQGGIERFARLANRDGTRQHADGKQTFHPGKQLNPHAPQLTRPLGQDQRLGELMTGGVGVETGFM